MWGALAVVCAGVATAQTTTITGKVYSPNGPTAGDPIPNILVYVAQTAVQPFTQGIAYPGQGCAAQPNLVSGNPLVEALTAADGSFTLTSTNMPNPVNIVIQAGKWRRQYPNTPVTIGGTTTLQLTMPANQSQGDLPHIAVITGTADAIECIFNQIGISNSEFTDPTGSGSINLYAGTGTSTSGGAVVSSSSPKEPALLESSTTLNTYDLVMFGCQGTPTDTIASSNAGGALDNLVSYTSSGGRLFTTHYEYIWLEDSPTFKPVAAWGGSFSASTGVNYPATIVTSYAEGEILAQWMQNVGGLSNVTPPEVELGETRQNTTAVNAPAQSWANMTNPCTGSGCYTGLPSMQFTFDTPIGATSTPTVALAYSNSSAQFQPGDTADTVTVDVTNNSTSAANQSLTLSITLPSGLTATSLTDTTGGWSCVIGSPVSNCSRSTPLAAGSSDNVVVVFSIASTTGIGQATITASLSGGGLSNTGQCGRVLYNDYHVETPNSGRTYTGYYPTECPTQTSLNAQQKFLEFSLYNLSNFVSPSSTDIIDIQGTPTITWPSPAAMPYGTALTSTQLDATATYGGAAVAGTFVYTPAAGTVMTTLGPNTLNVVFTPTNTTDYTGASGSTMVQVVADTTGVVVTSGTDPSYYAEPVTLSAAVSTNGAVAAAQTVNFFDGLTQIGTGTTNAQGVATYTTSALIVGTHNITACVVASADFNASCSANLIQLVTLVPTPPLTTSTVLTSNANPSFVGQNVTFTAGVSTTGAFTTIPGGMVTFYDGATSTAPGTMLGTGTLDANGFTTFSTTALALGTHSITAVYAGTNTLATSTSNVVLQVVLTSLPSAGSGYLLTVNPINVSLAVGTTQAVNVSVLTLNNYQQTVTLSCTGNFPGGGCVLGQTLMPVGGGSTTISLTAVAPHACGASTQYFSARNNIGSKSPLLALGGLGLGLMLVRRRRRLMRGLALAVVLCALPTMTMLSGCGGGCTDLGTQPGAYTLTVTAVSGGTSPVTQTQQVVVNVHL